MEMVLLSGTSTKVSISNWLPIFLSTSTHETIDFSSSLPVARQRICHSTDSQMGSRISSGSSCVKPFQNQSKNCCIF